jgi:hypothetical protein
MSRPLTNSKITVRHRHPWDRQEDDLMPISGEAIMENVRRYRATASLWRRTAAFRPLQRLSLLEEAERWEHLALRELEAYFKACNSDNYYGQQPYASSYAAERWGALAAAA